SVWGSRGERWVLTCTLPTGRLGRKTRPGAPGPNADAPGRRPLLRCRRLRRRRRSRRDPDPLPRAIHAVAGDDVPARTKNHFALDCGDRLLHAGRSARGRTLRPAGRRRRGGEGGRRPRGRPGRAPPGRAPPGRAPPGRAPPPGSPGEAAADSDKDSWPAAPVAVEVAVKVPGEVAVPVAAGM